MNPDDETMDAFLRDLMDLAHEHGVDVDAAMPDPEQLSPMQVAMARLMHAMSENPMLDELVTNIYPCPRALMN